MSILKKLFSALTGSSKEKDTVTERPCANCPSDCAIAGEACTVCEPYKKKLIDTIYYVNNLEEFLNRYEVVGLAGLAAVNCPHCGAVSNDPYICEYCGSKLSEGSGKIRVAKASDIPNPVMQAQDIIWERAEAVIKYAEDDSTESSGILDELLSALTGSAASDSAENPLGAKMSEDEIKQAASLYGVTVGEYLTGLDNGKYLTLAGKKKQDTYASTGTGSTAASIPGVAGVGMMAGAMFGSHTFSRPPRPPMSHHQNAENRPSEANFHKPQGTGQTRPGNGGPHGSGHTNARPGGHNGPGKGRGGRG